MKLYSGTSAAIRLSPGKSSAGQTELQAKVFSSGTLAWHSRDAPRCRWRWLSRKISAPLRYSQADIISLKEKSCRKSLCSFWQRETVAEVVGGSFYMNRCRRRDSFFHRHAAISKFGRDLASILCPQNSIVYQSGFGHRLCCIAHGNPAFRRYRPPKGSGGHSM